MKLPYEKEYCFVYQVHIQFFNLISEFRKRGGRSNRHVKTVSLPCLVFKTTKIIIIKKPQKITVWNKAAVPNYLLMSSPIIKKKRQLCNWQIFVVQRWWRNSSDVHWGRWIIFNNLFLFLLSMVCSAVLLQETICCKQMELHSLKWNKTKQIQQHQKNKQTTLD